MNERGQPTDDRLFRSAELACRRNILFLKCQMPTAKSERSYRFLSQLVRRERDRLRRIQAARAGAPSGRLRKTDLQ